MRVPPSAHLHEASIPVPTAPPAQEALPTVRWSTLCECRSTDDFLHLTATPPHSPAQSVRFQAAATIPLDEI